MNKRTHIYRDMENHSKIPVMCPVIVTIQAVHKSKNRQLRTRKGPRSVGGAEYADPLPAISCH